MIKLIRKFYIAIIVSALFVGIRPATAGAPELTLNILRETKVWTAPKVVSMIEFVAVKYNCNKKQMICLAAEESSTGMDKRCGDNEQSCGLFQYKDDTWKSFNKIWGEAWYSKYNYVDQAIVTCHALNNNEGHNWSPILDGRCPNNKS